MGVGICRYLYRLDYLYDNLFAHLSCYAQVVVVEAAESIFGVENFTHLQVLAYEDAAICIIGCVAAVDEHTFECRDIEESGKPSSAYLLVEGLLAEAWGDSVQ